MAFDNRIIPWLIFFGQWTFILAVASLLVRRNDLAWPLKRLFELNLLVSLGAAGFWLIWTGQWQTVRKILEKIWQPLALILAGLLLATTISYLLYGTVPDRQGILNLGRIIMVMTAVILIRFYHQQSPQFLSYLSAAFLVNLLFIFAFITPSSLRDSWQITAGRFQGFENYPSNASYLFLIVLVFCFSSLLYRLEWRPDRQALLSYLGSISSMVFIWWSQSRATWLAAIAALAATIFVYHRQQLTRLPVSLLLAVSIVISSHGLLTIFDTGLNAARRFWQTAQYHQNINPHLPTIRLTDNLFIVNDQQPRLYAWRHYFETTLKNPWGLGVAYFYQGLAGEYEGKPIGPHNTILEILVMGGVVALVGFIWLWRLALRQVRDNPFLLGVLIGFLVAVQFDNMIAFKALWIILGIALAEISPAVSETRGA